MWRLRPDYYPKTDLISEFRKCCIKKLLKIKTTIFSLYSYKYYESYYESSKDRYNCCLSGSSRDTGLLAASYPRNPGYGSTGQLPLNLLCIEKTFEFQHSSRQCGQRMRDFVLGCSAFFSTPGITSWFSNYKYFNNRSITTLNVNSLLYRILYQ